MAADIATVRRRLRQLVESLGYTISRHPLQYADAEARTVDHVASVVTEEAGRELWVGGSAEVRTACTITLATSWYDADPHEVTDRLAADAERLVSILTSEPGEPIAGEPCPDYYALQVGRSSPVQASNGPCAVVVVRVTTGHEVDAERPSFDSDGHLEIRT